MKAFLFHVQSNKKIRIKGEMTIGRIDCDRTFPDDARMSRTHGTVRLQNETLTLEDLDSKNGILLNDELVPPHVQIPLKNGAKVVIGDQEFEVLIEGQETPLVEGLSRTEVSLEGLDKTVPDGQTNFFQFGNEPTNEVPKKWEAEQESKSSSFITSSILPDFGDSSGTTAENLKVAANMAAQKNSIPGDEGFLIDPNLLTPQNDEDLSPSNNRHSEFLSNPLADRIEISLSSAKPETSREVNDKSQNAHASRDKTVEKENLSRSQPHTPKSAKSEEIIYMRTSCPGLWRGLLLALILLTPVPAVFLLDKDNYQLIKQIVEPQLIALWISAILLPAFLLIGPLQAVRIRTGWSRGWKSLFLSLSGMSLIASFQFMGINEVKKATHFSQQKNLMKIRRACVNEYQPHHCTEVIFNCPSCLKKLNYADRQMLLESIYPFVEELTHKESSETVPSRLPAKLSKEK